MSTSYNLVRGDVCHGSQGQRHWSEFLPILTHLAGVFILTFISKMQRLWFVQRAARLKLFSQLVPHKGLQRSYTFCVHFHFSAGFLMWSPKQEVRGTLLHGGKLVKPFFFLSLGTVWKNLCSMSINIILLTVRGFSPLLRM